MVNAFSTYFPFRSKIFRNLLIFVVCLFCLLNCPQVYAAEKYFATESGHGIEVITPEGKKKLLFGNFTVPSARHYRLEIPLESLEDPFTSRNPSSTNREILKEKEIVKEKEIIKEGGSNKQTQQIQQPEKKKIVVEYDNTDKLVVETNYLFNQGRYYEATIYVEELLRKNPDYARGWVMKGSLMYVQGHKDLAKKAWKQALELEPDNKEVVTFLQRVE